MQENSNQYSDFEGIPFFEKGEKFGRGIVRIRKKFGLWAAVSVVLAILLAFESISYYKFYEDTKSSQKNSTQQNITQKLQLNINNGKTVSSTSSQTAKGKQKMPNNDCETINSSEQSAHVSKYYQLDQKGGINFYAPLPGGPYEYPPFEQNPPLLSADFKEVKLVSLVENVSPTSSSSATLYVGLVNTFYQQLVFKMYIQQPGNKSIQIDVAKFKNDKDKNNLNNDTYLAPLPSVILPERIAALDTTLTIKTKSLVDNVATYSATLQYIGTGGGPEISKNFDITVSLLTTQPTFNVFQLNFGTGAGDLILPVSYSVCK